MKRLAPLLTLLLSFALMAPAAFAQSDVAGYGGQGGQVESAVTEGGGGSSDPLPFTGLEIGMLLAIAVALALVGFTLRRLTRHAARENG